jgi:hypothetical protein
MALRAVERRSFNRACAALFIAHRRGTQPKSFWRDDDDADVILRAASNPLATTGTFPQIQATKIFPLLAPDSASSKLLAMGANLSLDGIATVKIPYIGGSGRPAKPALPSGSSWRARARPRRRLRNSAARMEPKCGARCSTVRARRC